LGESTNLIPFSGQDCLCLFQHNINTIIIQRVLLIVTHCSGKPWHFRYVFACYIPKNIPHRGFGMRLQVRGEE
jgi:hypothetical protein